MPVVEFAFEKLPNESPVQELLVAWYTWHQDSALSLIPDSLCLLPSFLPLSSVPWSNRFPAQPSSQPLLLSCRWRIRCCVLCPNRSPTRLSAYGLRCDTRSWRLYCCCLLCAPAGGGELVRLSEKVGSGAEAENIELMKSGEIGRLIRAWVGVENGLLGF
jgi:hypothetical protein